MGEKPLIDQIGDGLNASKAMPSEVRMSPLAYARLRAWEQAVTLPKEANSAFVTAFGIRIIEDPSLAPGEWKLVTP
jgi:hypothetical protein